MRLLFLLLAGILSVSAATPTSSYFSRNRAIRPVLRTATDSNGNTYIAGTTFPAGTNDFDIFLTKLDTDLHEIYTTTWGGDAVDQVNGITLGPGGDVYIVGITTSTNYPVVGAAQARTGGASDAFVTRLTPNGGFVYSTYLGGSGEDGGMGIAVDGSGNAYVTGSTASQDFFVTPGAFQTTKLAPNGFATSTAAFVTKLTPQGQIAFSTFLAGTRTTCNGGSSCIPAIASSGGTAILVDATGAAYVGGGTNSLDFPVTAGAFKQDCACSFRNAGGFLSKLNPTGSALLASTFVPGATIEAIDTDGTGNLAATGKTAVTLPLPGGGTGFPTTSGALHELVPGESRDATAIAFKISGALDHMIFATYLTGTGASTIGGLRVDTQGNLLLSGTATAAGMLASAGAPSNGEDFFAKLRADGKALIYASRLPAGSAAASLSTSQAGDVLLFGASGFISRNPPSGTGYTPPPILGIANAAGSATSSRAVSGELISIYGIGIGPAENTGARLDSSGRVASELAGTQVRMNGMPAPLTFVGPNQINAVVPAHIFEGSPVGIELIRNGQNIGAIELLSKGPLPEVFRTTGAAGSNPVTYGAAALNEDGSINSLANPAKRGSVVTIFATGIPMNYFMIDGSLPTTSLDKPLSPVAIKYNLNSYAEVLYAGQAPGLVAGVLQVNFRIPIETQFVGFGVYQLQAGTNLSQSFAIFLPQLF